jgi:Protein of unknown function (DUF1176)
MLFTFLLPIVAEASVSLYTGPRPEETATYKDWVTGCDNERNCEAVALEAAQPGPDGGTDHLEIIIEQPLAKHKGPTISLKFPFSAAPQPELRLFVDKKEVKIPAPAERRVKIEGEAARKLIGQLRKGNWASLLDAEGNAVARASLLGLTTSLLRLDKQQGKLDTPEALVRPGKRIGYDDLPGYSVSLSRPAPSRWAPPSFDTDDWHAASGPCAVEERLKPGQLIRLDDQNSLAIVPWACGNGAYTFYANIMIVSDAGAFRPAEFDYDNGITGDRPSNVVSDPVWIVGERVLEAVSRFRAVGDCGRTDRFIWDGSRFRLSEQRVMPECRGSFDRIRVWKVDVTDR